ncbi:MAG: PAS domain S-box protein [Candidatus Yonathbacteria bacterium]|nr:PAS domain S-box protein [Candidatus Yonathbacteria bacterium]NTW47926.1 PAS domain S-box protein [Candidatus Yonathbacteria bacterium]
MTPTPTQRIPLSNTSETSWMTTISRIAYLLAIFVAFLSLCAGGFFILTPNIVANALGIAPMFVQIGVSICVLIFTAIAGLLVGNVQRELSHANDITQRLKETRDRYAEILESSGAGAWERNLLDDSLYVSDHWRSLFGYDEQHAPKTYAELLESVHPDDVSALKETLTHAIGGGMRVYKTDYRLKTNSGNWRYIIEEGTIERTSDGIPMHVSGSTRDISAIREAEELLRRRTDELRKANERIHEEMLNTKKFAQAVASSNEAILITDTTGIILYANNAWEALTGVSPEKALGTYAIAPFEALSPISVAQSVRQTFHDGTTLFTDDLAGTRGNNTPYNAEVYIAPISEHHTPIFYTAIFSDVTKRKAVDKAKTEFVSLASHQLRTPLSTIRWYTEMLLSENMAIPEESRSYIKEIYDANKRMIELVESLLNVSRLDLGTMRWIPEPIRPIEAAKTALKELQPLAREKHITIIESFATDAPDIMFDRAQMHMIFQNLLSNAVKYTPQNGVVEITIQKEGTEHLFFSVKDNGYGIPADQQSRIFNKMFRADNAKAVDATGTGLGLYIIKHIIESDGGSIHFDSEVGKGSTFYGILPIQPIRKVAEE